jgi:hypothetical protein
MEVGSEIEVVNPHQTLKFTVLFDCQLSTQLSNMMCANIEVNFQGTMQNRQTKMGKIMMSHKDGLLSISSKTFIAFLEFCVLK